MHVTPSIFIEDTGKLGLFPPAVGYYEFGGLRIELNKKPRWLTRFMMRHVVQWEWVDG